MTSPSAGGLRVLRAAALATATVALALTAHALAGGHVPGGLALAAAVVGVGCAAVLLTGRRLGRAATVAGLLVGQALLHAWFSLASGQACAVTSALVHVHGGAAHCADPVAAAATAPATATTTGPTAMAVMVLAHLGAIVLTGLLLAHGDALLWRLAAAVLRRRPRAARPVPLPAFSAAPVRATCPVVSSAVLRVPRLRAPPVPHPAA